MVSKKTTLSLAIGSAFAATVAMAPVASAAHNPFQMESLKNGYQVAAADNAKDGKPAAKAAKRADGKCGEGRCGGGGASAEKKKDSRYKARNRVGGRSR